MTTSHAIASVSETPTPKQMKEFWSQVANGRITKRKLQSFLRDGKVLKNEDMVRLILGDDIVFPDEIAEARGLSYTDEQLRHFAETLPSEEALRWCKVNGYALVAGPPQPKSLLDVRQMESGLFYSKTGGWHEGQKFARDDKAPTEWLAIRKEQVPNSTNRNWNEQLGLIRAEERVPNAGEMSWFVTTFFKVRGVRLFESVYVRTYSVVLHGDRVIVGYFNSYGLRFYVLWDGYRNDGIGVSSARKFN